MPLNYCLIAGITANKGLMVFRARRVIGGCEMEMTMTLHWDVLNHVTYIRVSPPYLLEYGNIPHAGSTFSFKFGSGGILPGDASLIDEHSTHIVEAVVDSISQAGSLEGFSELWRLRATILASVLLQLVILRIYLRRPSSDDIQIYFLARHFTAKEVQEISTDDPFAGAKKGMVPEWSSATSWLATAYDADREQYNWNSGSSNQVAHQLINSTTHDQDSSPLSDPPAYDSLMHDGSGFNLAIEDQSNLKGALKRQREDDSEDEDCRGNCPSGTANVGVTVRRSTRRRKQVQRQGSVA
ncbi:hypothetical protein B0H19DRAFT_1067804 [Mycena capillaripes]|nr:hypothetical protein B0H19DRAFT_1077952 [Mycena capillaripes]KAJ6564215.1 hypothetical protein B0H19DRAFT_1067804 [Mycena capillaripes]